MSDISLFILTGSLKRKEMVSGRFADAIAAMYEMSACLKLYEERFKNNEKVSKVCACRCCSWLPRQTLQ